MYRTLSYSETDLYCRYLRIDLNNNASFKMCGSDFLSFTKNTLKLEKLPYKIKLWDAILDGCLVPDLFVSLPVEYFLNWQDYPFLGNASHNKDDAAYKDAGFYNLRMKPNRSTTMTEYSHAFDEHLKSRFKDRFSASVSAIKKIQHPNGRELYPNECYLAYWKAYIIFGSDHITQFRVTVLFMVGTTSAPRTSSKTQRLC